MLKLFLKNDKGEAYVGQAVKIVIAIVLGVALLTGAVLIFNNIILPKTEAKIEQGFGYADKLTENMPVPEYRYLVQRIKTEVNLQLDDKNEAERETFIREIEDAKEAFPEAFPPDFEPDDFRDGETYMNACYAMANGKTYEEAVKFSKTTAGQRTYLAFFDGWFEG